MARMRPLIFDDKTGGPNRPRKLTFEHPDWKEALEDATEEKFGQPSGPRQLLDTAWEALRLIESEVTYRIVYREEFRRSGIHLYGVDATHLAHGLAILARHRGLGILEMIGHYAGLQDPDEIRRAFRALGIWEIGHFPEADQEGLLAEGAEFTERDTDVTIHPTRETLRAARDSIATDRRFRAASTPESEREVSEFYRQAARDLISEMDEYSI